MRSEFQMQMSPPDEDRNACFNLHAELEYSSIRSHSQDPRCNVSDWASLGGASCASACKPKTSNSRRAIFVRGILERRRFLKILKEDLHQIQISSFQCYVCPTKASVQRICTARMPSPNVRYLAQTALQFQPVINSPHHNEKFLFKPHLKVRILHSTL